MAVGSSIAGARPSTRPAIALATIPALTPAFDAHVHDYVVRCRHGRLRVRVALGSKTSAWIDGRRITAKHPARTLAKQADDATVVTDRRGRRRSAYHVRCLPSGFPSLHVRRTGRPTAAGYLATLARNISATGYVTIIDRRGVPVWWMRGGDRAAALLSGGRVAWVQRRAADTATSTSPFRIYSLDGRPVGEIGAVGAATDNHELRELPNGDFLILGDRPRSGVDLRRFGGPANATVLDGVVQELTPAGKLVWEWSTRGHIALAETGRWFRLQVLHSPLPMAGGGWAYDIAHLNSADSDGHGHILVSARHTDAVYEVSRATGAVEWKLGGTHTPQSLAVPGGHVRRLFGGQHDARFARDGTVTVQDNGTYWGRHPRALRFRIDPAAMRATLLERLEPDLSAFSTCCGSARKLSSGHWVASWGATRHIGEYTARGRPVLQIDLPHGYYSYRVEPIAPGRLAIASLRAAMDAAAARRGAR